MKVKEKIEEDINRRRITHQIQNLVGVTKSDFESLYLTTIDNFIEHVSRNDYSVERLDEALNNAVLALRKRQGYLLPLGGDSETSFREREEWTYAVFASALLKNIDQQNDSELSAIAKMIIPKEAYDWLYRNKQLFELWQAFLKGEMNIFGKMMDFVEPRVAEQHEALTREKIEGFTSPEQALDKIPNRLELTVSAFLDWLSQSIKIKSVLFNERESVIHRVELGFLLVLPNSVDRFIEDQARKFNIDSKDIAIDQRVAFIKALKKQDDLIRNAQGSRIHAYCFGKWEERQVLSGLVIKPEVISDVSIDEIPINNALTIDPMGFV